MSKNRILSVVINGSWETIKELCTVAKYWENRVLLINNVVAQWSDKKAKIKPTPYSIILHSVWKKLQIQRELWLL